MRIASICAVVAFSPRRTRTGSVGITLEIRKTMMTSPASVGMNQASRERIISRRRMERPRALFRTARILRAHDDERAGPFDFAQGGGLAACPELVEGSGRP